jgi:hypothetical protein
VKSGADKTSIEASGTALPLVAGAPARARTVYVAGFVLVGRLTSVIEHIRHLNEEEHSSFVDMLQSEEGTAKSNGKQPCRALPAGQREACGVVHQTGPPPQARQVRLEVRTRGFIVGYVVAVILLGASLFRFGQEVGMGLTEADHYR